MLKLLKVRGALAYVLVIFINAIVDLGDKIILQNTIFKIYNGSEQIVLTALVNALILLPYVMLFTPAGYLSDRFSKSKVLHHASKLALGIVILIATAYYFGMFKTALFLTFLLAAQSAIFSPAKYGLIKEMFGKEHLTEGNGLVQAVTIIAILLSSVLFSLFFESLITGTEQTPSEILQHVWSIALILILLAAGQVWLTKKIPTYLEGDKKLKFDFQKYLRMHYLRENFAIVTKNRVIIESIVGLGIFFGVAQVVLAIFGVHLKEVSGENNTVVAQGIMALAGIGIAVGSILTAKLSEKYIETGLIPIGAIGLVTTIWAITKTSNLYILGAEFFTFGIFGGFLIVVLNALIQYRAQPHELGRVMATSNFVQNWFMLIFLGLTMYSALNGLDTQTLFHILIAVVSLGAIYAFITLPQFLLRLVFKVIALFRYHLRIHGVENFPKDGAALLLGNHVSYIDWMVLSIASPRRVSFVIERTFYEKWYLKPFFRFFGVIPISTRASKDAFNAVKAKLHEGKIVCIFPEGALTRNGHLGKFQRGFELITKDIDVPIIPFYIRGLWGSRFSHAHEKLKYNVSLRERDIGVSFGKPLPSSTTASELKRAIFELQIESWSKYVDTLKPIQHSWLKMAKMQGEKLCVADATGTKLSNHKFAAVVFAFAEKIREKSGDEQNIGIVMPTSAGGALVNMAVFSLGKTVVNLNYTANAVSIAHAINLAQLRTIYTSRQFLTKLKAKGIDIEDVLQSTNLIYVEDLKEEIRKIDVLKKWALMKLLPYTLLEKIYLKNCDMNQTAAILFSSGSEGTPKGIELTHKNFMVNIKQFTNLLNLKDNDVIMATLPIFHSFGLTVATLAPLIEGVPFICQPDPTDAESVGKLTAKYHGTVLFGTSTFFRIYARSKKLHPLMFKSIRFVVGGAEKLSTDVREIFKKKFGLDIHEAYGTTETTPGISANIPDVLNTDFWHVQIGSKIGTVGMPFPGSSLKIVDPDTFEELPTGEEGMILIGGTQVMKGYLKDPQKTAEVIKEIDGVRWYVTGDKGKIDEDGFLTIVDRYSRFVKIGGEMISLSAVEEEIRKIIPEEVEIVAAGVPDSKKGEKIVLLYHGEIDEKTLKSLISKSNLNPLMKPSLYHYLEEMPKLGSGKTDLKKAKQIAMEIAGEA
jgi:acyl-[acyl-carrier-protein]-phospholipid O-acyltransferase/long-chain-fatty-acid--[acyl-carrier-protein] ligase